MNPSVIVNAAWPMAAGPHGVDAAALALASGADGLGLPESPRLFDDPLIITERVLAGTDAPFAGPCVLSLGLRHPGPVAAALRTLAEGRPRRLFAVLARGESSVRNEGLAPPSLVSHLTALETVVDGVGDAEMTLLGAGSGPLTIAGTAERLRGVLIDVGADPDVVSDALSAARAARPDCECWLFLRAVATASAQDERSVIASLLGSAAARLVASPEWYRVPADLLDDLEHLVAGHDYRRHGTAAARTADDDGAAAEFVRQAFFVTGDASAIARRTRPLAADGLAGIVLAGGMSAVPARLSETIAGLRAGLSGNQEVQ